MNPDFIYFPNECQESEFLSEENENSQTTLSELQSLFISQCSGQKSCSFTIEDIEDLTQSGACSPPWFRLVKELTATYVMTASCSDPYITFFDNEDLTMTNEAAAIIVVIIDLVVILSFWIALICSK
jgi:hypothetical protein